MSDLIGLLAVLFLAGLALMVLLTGFTLALLAAGVVALFLLPGVIVGMVQALREERKAEDSNLTNGDPPDA